MSKVRLIHYIICCLTGLVLPLSFVGCNDELTSTIITLSPSQSYEEHDDHILYYIQNDSLRTKIDYLLSNDTVTTGIASAHAANNKQTTQLIKELMLDPEVSDLGMDAKDITFTTSCFNGLCRKQLIDILAQRYVYIANEEEDNECQDEERAFRPISPEDLCEGMYVYPVIQKDGETIIYSGNDLRGDMETDDIEEELDCEKEPWRITSEGRKGQLIINLPNGEQLKRQGNPLTMPIVRGQREGYTLWTILYDPASKAFHFQDYCEAGCYYYGVYTREDNAMTIGINHSSGYQLYAAPVTITCYDDEKLIYQHSTYWGSDFTLPDLPLKEGTTRAVWSLSKDEITGSLQPGQKVVADNTTYYAIYIK